MNRYIFVFLFVLGMPMFNLAIIHSDDIGIVAKIYKQGDDWYVVDPAIQTDAYCEYDNGRYYTNQNEYNYCQKAEPNSKVVVSCGLRTDRGGEAYCYTCGANKQISSGGECPHYTKKLSGGGMLGGR